MTSLVSGSYKFDERGRRNSTGSKRRSESSSRIERVKDSRRTPLVNTFDEKDVPTLVSMEVSRAIMANPEVNLGIFLKSAANSRRDLSISDSTLIISAAILEHIGNVRMSKKLLAKSSTLDKMYSKMGLNDTLVREVFVTILFTTNPMFVQMIETSIRIATGRSSEKGEAPFADQQIANAMVNLTVEGSISGRELAAASNLDTDLIPDIPSPGSTFSYSKTPVDSVKPNDSISVIKPTNSLRRSRTMTQNDVTEYLSRRKRGIEPEFGTIFTRSKPPISIETRPYRAGLGYDEKTDKTSFFKRALNDILGNNSVASYNINTGNVTSRKPRVEDFIDSESIAGTVMYSVPDVPDDVESKINYKTGLTYTPTDSYLPDSVVETPRKQIFKRVDSAEELMKRLNEAGL